MKILQFKASELEAIQDATRNMLLTINGWSLLSWRAENNEGQVTLPFGDDIFHQHTTDPELWWVNWSEIYPHLGQIGQSLADLQIGSLDSPGVLLGSYLGSEKITTEKIKLELVEVADLVAAGYLPDDGVVAP
jgi:hypothetical protein